MSITVAIELCDVADKERLALFRHLRRQWLEMLNGDDEHAICKQLTALLDADLEFRTINHSRKLCEDAGVPQNGMVHLFIDRGFVAHQAFAIRRITEENDMPRKRAVYSLHRVIDEVELHRELFTREMYVCADGDPYDQSIRTFMSSARHKNFDELARVAPSDRSRSDLIHPDTFSELRKRFQSSHVFRTYANKLLAHAADPATRKGNVTFRLADLEQAYTDLIWITNRLSATVLFGASHEFLPHYAVDILESIDQPICPPSALDKLWEYWETRHRELELLERRANGREAL